MVEIDGSHGEGGGQVLRTALTLSALTGMPTHIHHIRAGRRKPGLAPQHLTGVLALAQVCDADVRGAAIGSMELTFQPRARPRPGAYVFDVTQTAQRGSAGAVTLLLQTLLPLAFAGGASHLTLKGGTHVPWSPPFDYVAQVYLPTVARMGLQAGCHLEAWGFYPAGGGQISVDIDGVAGSLTPLTLVARGALKRVRGVAVACNLSADIAQRIANRARNVLKDAGMPTDITPRRERGAGPGAGLFLIAEYEHALAGFSALGAKGKPSEQVADEACRDLLAHHAGDAPVDEHLADQLLLPMALADGRSEFRTFRITQHLLANMHIIRHFIPARIEIGGNEGEPGTILVQGVGVPKSTDDDV
ncbi:MAG: RNA 3'-terminal phosphate cyclase [Anaerolineae bacterium]